MKAGTDRNLYRFRSDPDWGHCEPMWRMSFLVTAVKRDFGAAYNPMIRDEIATDVKAPITDSRTMFLHGLLDDDPKCRWGTCASIPVLVVAIAQRLGYPVSLVVAGRHILARWEGDGLTFNIEASNAMGMTVLPDDEYRQFINKAVKRPQDECSSYYLRALSPAEAFALFLSIRVECLFDAARCEESLLWSARALQFAPDDPCFIRQAYYALDLAMKHRFRRRHPQAKIPPIDDPNPLVYNLGELLRREEFSLYMTITAHYHEYLGELDAAREVFEDACRHNYHGNNEQRDLQRFLRKHDLPPKRGPLMPPVRTAYLRRFTLRCPLHEEARTLLQLSHQFEAAGELVKARDALHDLYLFDPGHSGVFQRARSIERHPQFQQQLRALMADRRRARQQSNAQRKVISPIR